MSSVEVTIVNGIATYFKKYHRTSSSLVSVAAGSPSGISSRQRSGPIETEVTTTPKGAPLACLNSPLLIQVDWLPRSGTGRPVLQVSGQINVTVRDAGDWTSAI
jgi:hypothetical protein